MTLTHWNSFAIPTLRTICAKSMMTKALLASLLVLPVLPAEAGGRHHHHRSGFSKQCFKEVYREKYVPGTKGSPGYVRRWTETKAIPCRRRHRHHHRHSIPGATRHHHHTRADDNSCIEGSIIGGIIGGGIGGAAATKENWIWSIPTGVAGGALIGCQVDGG